LEYFVHTGVNGIGDVYAVQLISKFGEVSLTFSFFSQVNNVLVS